MFFTFMRIACIAILIIACAKKNNRQLAEEKVNKPSSSNCNNRVIRNEYLVLWKNGRITHIENKNHEQLIEDVVLPNLEDIEVVDPNIEISINLPKASIESQDFFGKINWGVQQINAPAVWDQNIKGQGVIVAVIDSGLDVEHPLIKNQLAINTNEIPNNNIDDDNNGYVDDYKGYNFFTKTGNITDSNGHGTHVAGTIVSEHIADPTAPKGVAPQAKVLGLGFMDIDGSGSLASAVEAINYAVKRGAKVINASWGGPSCDIILRTRIHQLENEGVLFVTASGNDGQNLDFFDTYPAKYIINSQITVGASTPLHFNAHFSNHSENYVHITAPGVDIYQTYSNSSYAPLDGTSMAAPHVAGAAALLLSAKPSLTPAEVKSILLNTAQDNFYPVSSNGELDIKAAIDSL